MLSPREIDELVAFLGTATNRLDAADTDLSHCSEIALRFGALRQQYLRQPQSLVAHVDKLGQLRRRFDTWLAKRLPEVVDRFQQITEQIRAAEQERGYWREFLIRTATASGTERLQGVGAAVAVRSIQSRTLPAASSQERQELEALIRESGQWSEVSRLSARKLAQALSQNRFGPPVAEQVERLCPSRVVHQVTGQRVKG